MHKGRDDGLNQGPRLLRERQLNEGAICLFCDRELQEGTAQSFGRYQILQTSQQLDILGVDGRDAVGLHLTRDRLG